MVQSRETGKACCMATWKAELYDIYECPFGFWDFSIPIVLPDGQVLVKVLAGQALSVNQKEEEILQKVAELGIDEKTVKEVLSRVKRKKGLSLQEQIKLYIYQTVIENTGIGMSEEFLPHLFEEFTRERSSTESKLMVPGLGCLS